MADKLLFLKNVIEKIDELEVRHKDLEHVRTQLNSSTPIQITGEMKIGCVTLPLQNLTNELSSEISSHLHNLMAGYVDILISENERDQQSYLSKIQIDQADESDVDEIQKKKMIDDCAFETETSIEPPSTTEALPCGQLDTPPTTAEVLTETADSPQNAEITPVGDIESEQSESHTENAIAPSPTDAPFVSEVVEDGDPQQVDISKRIASAFYSYAKGAYIPTVEIQKSLLEKWGENVSLKEIDDLAWKLISNDILESRYRIQCTNGHDPYTDYITPPIPRRIPCPNCHKEIANVDICYLKISE